MSLQKTVGPEKKIPSCLYIYNKSFEVYNWNRYLAKGIIGEHAFFWLDFKNYFESIVKPPRGKSLASMESGAKYSHMILNNSSSCFQHGMYCLFL